MKRHERRETTWTDVRLWSATKRCSNVSAFFTPFSLVLAVFFYSVRDFHRLRFYSPKFILIGIYLMCRVSFEYFGRVHLGFVPLTRLINLSFFIKSGW